MTIEVINHQRRSMIYRLLAAGGAHFESRTDAACAMHYGDLAGELKLARRLGIADLSTSARTGFKGRDTPAWLSSREVDLPEAPNRARLQNDGTLVARLSNDEHLFLGGPGDGAGLIERLDGAWDIQAGRMCYRMPRAHTHAWFAITGQFAVEMFSTVCGVDLRPEKFANYAIAQTSVARTNGIVIRADTPSTPVFHLLADSASAEYLWTGLLDALQPFRGGPVGLASLEVLISESVS